MTYEEAYETGYAIGFHKGRMAKLGNWTQVQVDQNFLVQTINRNPEFSRVLMHRYEQGQLDGED